MTTNTHGGRREGAGRKPMTLDHGELTMLHKLLTESPYATEYADTAEKLRRQIEKKEKFIL